MPLNFFDTLTSLQCNINKNKLKTTRHKYCALQKLPIMSENWFKYDLCMQVDLKHRLQDVY